jgi:D-3-phosphoglycerate dehydrogenase
VVNVVVWGPVSEVGEAALRAELARPEYDLAFEADPAEPDLDRLANAEVVLADSVPLTPDQVAAARSLRLLQRIGRGPFDISGETAAAHARGVPVAHNRTGFAAGPTAEHTVMVILALLRGLLDSDRFVRGGQWSTGPGGNRRDAATFELAGRRVGLIGAGKVARAVAPPLAALGAHVSYCRRQSVDDAALAAVGARGVESAALLAESDIVSVHARSGPGEVVLDRAALEAMKPGAYVVNTARGGLVDVDALAELLAAGRLAGAALDVFADEPPAAGHALLGLPNVILTPHVAGRTREAAERYFRAACANVHRLRRGEPLHDVLAPEGTA